MKVRDSFDAVKQKIQNQPGLFTLWLFWWVNLGANGVIAFFLLPRSPLDIYPQYQYQIAYPGVEGLLSPAQVARVVLFQDCLVFGAFVGLALFLAWRKPGDLLALFTSALFIGAGVGIASVTFIESRYWDQAAYAWLDPLQNFWGFLSYLGLGVFIFIFPDGRFIPRFLGQWVAVYIAFTVVGLFLLQYILGDEGYPWMILDFLILFLGGVTSQVYRYKRHSTPLQRQQTKFVVFGLAAYPILGIAFVVLLAQLVPPAFRAGYSFLMLVVNYFLILLIPLTLTISIFRYRLWDINILVRRTLQYTLLTGLLTLLYFSGIALLQNLLTADSRSWMAGEAAATGDQPPAGVIVVTTLFIAALFNPLRRRIQDFIDRRFYRRKYDAEKALAEFAAEARADTDMERLSEGILGTVRETLRPKYSSLWIVHLQENKES